MKHFKILLIGVICFLAVTSSNAQPLWPPTGAPTTFPFLNVDPYLNGSIPPGLIVRDMNCDMYTDYSSGSAGNKFIAITWHYYDAGDYFVVFLFDEASGKSSSFSWPGKWPDVVLLDDGSGIPGHIFGIVTYVDVNNNVMMEKFGFSGAFGTGTLTGLPMTSWPIWIATGLPVVYYDDLGTTFDPPHIDAYADPVNHGNYFGNSNYTGITNFVATWCADSLTGNGKQIFTKNFTQPYYWPSYAPIVTPVYPPITIDKGKMPDIAAVSVFNGVSTYSNKAYITYASQNGADIKYAKWDMVSSSPSIVSTLESSVNPQWTPRIDAMNVENTSISGSKTLWRAVAEVVPSSREIHGYDYNTTSGTTTVTNYSSYAPLNTFDGYIPAIATGPGPDGYAPGASSAIGNTSYTAGWLIQNNQLHALSLDNSSSGLGALGRYRQINNAPVNSVIANYPVFAVSNSSNAGDDILTAWCDGTNVYAKHSTGNTFAFKMTDIMNQAIRPVSVYPNPAKDILQVSNITDADYTIVDAIGRIAASGKLTSTNNRIDIHSLLPGSYILNLNRDGNKQQAQFIKQ